MFPAIEVPIWHLGSVPIQPFGFLVMLGLSLAYATAWMRAPRYGLTTADLDGFAAWMLACAFVLAHVLDEVLYHPDVLADDPLSILVISNGLSSYGGFVGAFVGAVGWSRIELLERAPFVRLRPEPRRLLPICECVASVFPLGWAFGRAGCAVVHDHLGVASTSWLAVQFGAGPAVQYGPVIVHHGDQPRYDLGLLELFYTLGLLLAFAVTWRRKEPPPLGTYLAALCVLYPPVRFALDFLRLGAAEGGDERYLGLTPAQWACIVFFVVGLRMVALVRAKGRERGDVAPERPVVAATHDSPAGK
jgi:phosphatidylglycerol:prolipoprotein diacylglycerol transferase